MTDIRVSTVRNDRRVRWVQEAFFNGERTLTPVECALVAVVCDAMGCGPYDLGSWEKMRPFGLGVRFSVGRDLATVDGAALTRLVFSAHDHCARVSLQQAGFGGIAIRLWLREGRTGDFSARCPTPEGALARWRKHYPIDEVFK